MWEDPIVTEVRKVREQQAAQFNYDLQAIYAALKAAEQKSHRRKVTFPPKRLTPANRGEKSHRAR